MEVVLKEDIENLGHMGDVVKVKDGYARNYLLPRGLVVRADKQSLKALEHEQRMIAQRRERLNKEAHGISERLSRVSLEFAVKVGEEGRLFGSVTNMDIEKALKEQGVDVERRRIMLEAPIKSVGEYDVPIRLRPEVTPSIKVKVVSEDEPEGGEAVTASSEAQLVTSDAKPAPVTDHSPSTGKEGGTSAEAGEAPSADSPAAVDHTRS